MDPATNVFGESIEPCSEDPLTGFFRDGCCNTSDEDLGRHNVCTRVTREFLEFSRSRGNDLSTPREEFGFPGLRPGDQWCLCAARWQEALEAGAGPEGGAAGDPCRNPRDRRVLGPQAPRHRSFLIRRPIGGNDCAWAGPLCCCCSRGGPPIWPASRWPPSCLPPRWRGGGRHCSKARDAAFPRTFLRSAAGDGRFGPRGGGRSHPARSAAQKALGSGGATEPSTVSSVRATESTFLSARAGPTT